MLTTYLHNVFLSSITSIVLIFVLTVSVRYIVLPLTSKIFELNGDSEWFDECSPIINRIVWMVGLALIVITLLLTATSSSMTPKNSIDNTSNIQKIEVFEIEESRRVQDLEISTENVLSPMDNTGNVSKARILKLTDYKGEYDEIEVDEEK